MGNGKRFFSVALVLIILVGVFPAQVGAAAPGSSSGPRDAGPRDAGPQGAGPRVPVILVHGLTAGEERVWGERTAEAKGLFGRLVRAGYVPGRTLFCYDYGTAASSDYAALAKVGLGPLVAKVLAASGSDRADFVAFGSGALVARYWAAAVTGGAEPASGIRAGPAGPRSSPMRNLVMIAPPSHGQFQADLLKVLYHTDRLLRAAGAGRGGGAVAAAPDGPDGGAAVSEPPVFTGEDQYVAKRAQDYRALYADYVLEARLLGEGGAPAAQGDGTSEGPGPAPPPEFAVWLTVGYPDLIEEAIYGAQRPAGPSGNEAGPGPSASGTGAGSAESGLTLAYYELLSLRVGRQLYLAHVVAAGKPPPLPTVERLIEGSWRAELVEYLKELVLDWGLAKGKELWTRKRAGVGVRLGELLTNLGADTAAVSRLVPEYLAFPGPVGAGGSGPGAPRLVLCNWFLHEWQARERAGRSAGTRFVTIAGSCPSPLGVLGLGLGRNDLVVEASSALVEPAPQDVFALNEGLFSVHRLLPRSAGVAAAALEALQGRPAAGLRREDGPVPDSGSGVAVLWEPNYCPVAGGAGDSGASGDTGREGGPATAWVTVDVEAADPAGGGLDGLSAETWLTVAAAGTGTGDGGDPGDVPAPFAVTPLEAAGRDRSGQVVRGRLGAPGPGPGQVLVLGVRLVPDGSAGPGFVTMSRYLGRDTRIPFSYSVSRETTPAGAAAGNGPAPEGQTLNPASSPGSGGETGQDGIAPGTEGGETQDAPGDEPEEGTGSPNGSEGEPARGQAEIVPTPEPPLVSVVRVTKLTTDKREHRIYHVRWEWDFGDGERLSDEDPSHTTVTVEHTYPAAGRYTVSARSLANDGRLLRELTWAVEAGQGGAGSGDAGLGAGRDGGQSPGSDGRTFTFEAETIVEPVVKLSLEGPEKWVTGKPARFEIKAEVSWPPRTRRQVIRAYPGWKFDVVWEKPGKFEVRAAVTVRQSYEFSEKRITVANTYVVVKTIEIFTPGLTE